MQNQHRIEYRLPWPGGPQGMMTIEHIMDEIARLPEKDPLEVHLSELLRRRRP
ncbi:molybdopterin-dependent oxidoreductase [Vibrio lentus]|nr:molybdopterin-dependent oxidoreductase [Vibrio lentus]